MPVELLRLAGLRAVVFRAVVFLGDRLVVFFDAVRVLVDLAAVDRLVDRFAAAFLVERLALVFLVERVAVVFFVDRLALVFFVERAAEVFLVERFAAVFFGDLLAPAFFVDRLAVVFFVERLAVVFFGDRFAPAAFFRVAAFRVVAMEYGSFFDVLHPISDSPPNVTRGLSLDPPESKTCPLVRRRIYNGNHSRCRPPVALKQVYPCFVKSNVETFVIVLPNPSVLKQS